MILKIEILQDPIIIIAILLIWSFYQVSILWLETYILLDPNLDLNDSKLVHDVLEYRNAIIHI